MPSEGGHKTGVIKDSASTCDRSVEWSPVPGLWLPLSTAVSIWDKDIALNASQADLKCERVFINCRKTPSFHYPCLHLNHWSLTWQMFQVVCEAHEVIYSSLVCMCSFWGEFESSHQIFKQVWPTSLKKQRTSRSLIVCLPDADCHHHNLTSVEYDSGLDKHSVHTVFPTWKKF